MRLLPALLTGLFLCAPLRAQIANDAEPVAPSSDAKGLPTAFDPARHMRVDEVREGMKGYGLSVLSGTAITKFDVEVITILKDVLGAQKSVVMVRCMDAFMQHVGPIAGCSGSPIYLFDETGKARLLGAYAFGWDLSRDPIIGVQPIEYMLTLTAPPAAAQDSDANKITWSILQSEAIATITRPNMSRGTIRAPTNLDEPATDGLRSQSAQGPRLKQLMTPLSIRGMSQTNIDQFAPMLRSHGFEPMLGLGGGANDATGVVIEPGSVLGAAMLSGDLNLAAIGTCTEVIDGRAFGFGHPFTGEGATSVPMGAGAVNLVVPVLTSSFKLGSVGEVVGAIDMDGAYGVAGQIGAKAKTFPIIVEVDDQTTGRKKTYHYQCAIHQAMTPMLLGMALQSSISGEKELPPNHTITYDIEMGFEGNRVLKMSSIATSLAGDNVAQIATWPVMLLANNPLKRLNLEGVRVSANIRSKVETAEILSAALSGTTFKPGETAKIHLRLKPYRGDLFEKTIELALPETLDDGDYNISVADAASNLQFEIQSQPQRFAVRNVDELFKTVQTVLDETRPDRLFVRLSGTRQSLSIGRTALEKLPASKRAILEASARPDTATSVDTSVRMSSMDHPVSGSADLVIHVARRLP